jgi:hypothetical protein
MMLPVPPVSPDVKSREDLGVRNLVDLRYALEKIPPDQPPDPRRQRLLDELDRVAQRLLEVAEYLVAQGCSLGLLNPRSILLLGQGNELRVFLPDLGFVYQGKPGITRVLPWLDEDTSSSKRGQFKREWGALWDEGVPLAQLQDIGDPERFGKGPLQDPQPELRKLARLFAWLLRGKASRTIPSRREAPEAKCPVWALLDRVINGRPPGKVKSVQEFRELLQDEKYRLSSHFDGKGVNEPRPVNGGQPSRRWLAPVSVGGAGLLVGAVILVVVLRFWPAQTNGPRSFPTPSTERIALPNSSQVRNLIDQVNMAPTLTDKAKAITGVYTSWHPSLVSAERERELQARENLRFQLVREVYDEVRRLIMESVEDLDRRFEIIASIKGWVAWLHQLQSYEAHPQTLEQEKECLQFCQAWLDQQPSVP